MLGKKKYHILIEENINLKDTSNYFTNFFPVIVSDPEKDKMNNPEPGIS